MTTPNPKSILMIAVDEDCSAVAAIAATPETVKAYAAMVEELSVTASANPEATHEELVEIWTAHDAKLAAFLAGQCSVPLQVAKVIVDYGPVTGMQLVDTNTHMRLDYDAFFAA